METLTHLKTSARFIKKDNKTHSQLVVDKFIESCLHLDASIFEPYMSEDDVFADKEKYKFLTELKDLFDKCRLKANNNFKVSITNEQCRGCAKEKPVLNFEVRQSNYKIPVTEFGFLVDCENDMLKDIYRCYTYKESHGEWCPV